MEKLKLRILVVNRPLESEELKDGKFYRSYEGKYDVIVSIANKKVTEVIFFNGQLKGQLEKLFSGFFISEEFFSYYLFNINGMEEKKFFEKINSKFEIIKKSTLTSIEREKEYLLKKEENITILGNFARSIL